MCVPCVPWPLRLARQSRPLLALRPSGLWACSGLPLPLCLSDCSSPLLLSSYSKYQRIRPILKAQSGDLVNACNDPNGPCGRTLQRAAASRCATTPQGGRLRMIRPCNAKRRSDICSDPASASEQTFGTRVRQNGCPSTIALSDYHYRASTIGPADYYCARTIVRSTLPLFPTVMSVAMPPQRQNTITPL